MPNEFGLKMSNKLVELALHLQHVTRFNADDMLRTNNVAEHSFNATVIAWNIAVWLNTLEKKDPIAFAVNPYRVLIRTLFHDVLESETGDIQYPTKNHQSFKEAYDKYESEISKEVCLSTPAYLRDYTKWLSYTDDPVDTLEYKVVKSADYLDFTLYCIQEGRRGNRRGLQLAKKGFEVIEKYLDPRFSIWGSPYNEILASLKVAFKHLTGGKEVSPYCL